MENEEKNKLDCRPSQIVDAHKKGKGPDDMNYNVDISAKLWNAPSGIEVVTEYVVSYTDGDRNYVTALCPYAGLTHEALIAILLHRLNHYQGTPTRCVENAQAIGHLEAALAALNSRSDRVRAEGELLAQLDKALDPTARVRLTGTPDLRIGDASFSIKALKAWGTWSDVITAAKKLDAGLTQAEMDVISFVVQSLDILEAVADYLVYLPNAGRPGYQGYQHISFDNISEFATKEDLLRHTIKKFMATSIPKVRHGGAHNGFIELKSALSTTHVVPKEAAK